MNEQATMPDRRFYRDKDRAILGGVCAGVADYFGFNLKVTRFLAFIAFLMAMPMAILAYFALVLLVPSRSLQKTAEGTDPEFKRALRSSPTQTKRSARSAGAATTRSSPTCECRAARALTWYARPVESAPPPRSF